MDIKRCSGATVWKLFSGHKAVTSESDILEIEIVKDWLQNQRPFLRLRQVESALSWL